VTLSGQISSAPFFDDLAVGQVFDRAPSMTLSPGTAAVHQSILGDPMRLPLDAALTRAVTGATAALAHPAMVSDVAIGQSTLATQRVKANLFYRGLTYFRYPIIGDTLYTRTEVVGLKQNSTKPGRDRTGLAALRMTTVDQADRLVLDFYRCAMLPLSPDAPDTGHADDLSTIGVDAGTSTDPTAEWDADAFRARVPGPHFDPDVVGAVLTSTGDVVSSAPELARLSLNIAATHHDWRVNGHRLVYGGHTIGLALAQATRLMPNLVTVLGWDSCDHTGPVREDDTLYSELHVEAVQTSPSGRGGVLSLRSLVYAVGGRSAATRGVSTGEPDRQVLDWRFRALQF
jgi:acyl dehydratase